jgi:hypothetical protein
MALRWMHFGEDLARVAVQALLRMEPKALALARSAGAEKRTNAVGGRFERRKNTSGLPARPLTATSTLELPGAPDGPVADESYRVNAGPNDQCSDPQYAFARD